jgi:hypothetical protein
MCDEVKISGRTYKAGADDYTTPPEASKDKQGSKVEQDKPDFTKEHQTIISRTTGKPCEISFGPLPGNLVPANPFSSISQQKYMYANPEVLGKKGLKEWSSKTDFKSLTKKVKK